MNNSREKMESTEQRNINIDITHIWRQISAEMVLNNFFFLSTFLYIEEKVCSKNLYSSIKTN